MSIPDRVEAIEVKGELKKKITSVAQHVVDVLQAETCGPKEALIVLHFVTELLKEKTGVKEIQVMMIESGEAN